MLLIKPSLNPHMRTAIQTNSVPTNSRLFISSERRHAYRPPRPTATLYLGWQGFRRRLADRRSTCPLPGRSSHKYCMNRSKLKATAVLPRNDTANRIARGIRTVTSNGYESHLCMTIPAGAPCIMCIDTVTHSTLLAIDYCLIVVTFNTYFLYIFVFLYN